MAEQYIACLDVAGRRCLVVGGGRVALDKTRRLLAAGALVTVVAPTISPRFHKLPLELLPRRFEARDLDRCWLVIAATSDPQLNEQVSRAAERRRVFCNVADLPDLCSFILPAIHRQGPISLAVSTGGASPALAQWLRDQFANQIGPEHERLAEELKGLRPQAKQDLATYEQRRDYFRRLVAEALT